MHDQEMAKVLEIIQSKYTSLAYPDFSFVEENLVQRPYEKILQELGQIFQVEEDTDTNDDVSFCYILKNADKMWILRLSMLGPYAVFLRLHASGHLEVVDQTTPGVSESEKTLMTLLAGMSIHLLDRQALLYHVPLSLCNTAPGNTRVYQALFTDSDILPWEESAGGS